jgi:hypothetical protein
MADKLFPPCRTSGPWSADDVETLKRYLGATQEEVIARVLQRPVDDVRARIFELGRIQKSDAWTRDETAEFKRIYGTRTDDDLARIFARSLETIRAHAREHALAKDKAFLRRLKGEPSTRMPRWEVAELEYLKREYPLCSNLELARKLARSVKSVVSKAHNLHLKKSGDRLREMGRENVSLRYR